MCWLVVYPPQKLLKISGVNIRLAQIDVDSGLVECRKKWLSVIIGFRGHTDKLVLISPCVNLGRNDLSLGSNTTLATISLLCVCAIEYHDYFLDFWISDHLLHEFYRVVALFE